MDVIKNIYDPFFIVKSNGSPIPDYLNERIIKFEFQEDYKKEDVFTIVLDNNDLQITDDTYLSIGSIITCKFGYLTRYTDFINAKIHDIEGFKEIKIIAWQVGSGYSVIVPNQEAYVQENQASNKIYEVKSGDTLSKIASIFNIKDWKSIYEVNKSKIGKNPNLITPGMILEIPGVVVKSNLTLGLELNTSNIYGKKTRVWRNMTYSTIASEIAKEMGLLTNITETYTKYSYTPQSNEDNFEFLRRIGRQIGFYPKIVGKLLAFSPKDYSTQSNYTLTYYVDGAGELENFYPKIKTKKSKSQSSSPSLDIIDKEPVVNTSNSTETTKLGKYSYKINSITGEEERILTPNKNLSNNKINKNSILDDDFPTSDVSMEDDEDGSITADLDCIGIPELKSNAIITVLGVGKKWSGNWFVKNVTHSIDSNGYKTKIEASRNALGEAAPSSEKSTGNLNESKAYSKQKSNKVVIVDAITGEETTGSR